MSTTATPATDKQIAYICDLAGVAYLSQVAHLVGMSHRQLQRLTKTEASRLIDQLKRGR